MSEPRLPDLARSFERHLRAENKSDRTVETYLEAVRLLEATQPAMDCLSRHAVALGHLNHHASVEEPSMASTPRTEVPMDTTTSCIRRRATAAVTTALAAVVLAALVVAAPKQAAPRPPADPNGAFLFRDGRFTPLGDIRGAALVAHVNHNNRGQVVGFYLDDQGVFRSFVKDRRGRVTTFAVPGAAATLAGGINDRGEIVIPDLDTGLTPITNP
jgi:hypothetical protein